MCAESYKVVEMNEQVEATELQIKTLEMEIALPFSIDNVG